MDEGRINVFQLNLLIMGLILSTSFFVVPTLVAGSANQDGWLSILLATLGGIVLLFMFLLLTTKFEPNENIISYSERLLGSTLSKVIGILFALYFMISNSSAIRLGGELIVTLNLPETPIEVIHIAIIALGCYAAWHGIEVIARFTTFFMPILLGVILIGLMLAWPEGSIENIQPVFEEGIKPIILASISPFGWMAQSVIVLLFYANLQRDKQIFLQLLLGVFIVGMTLMLIVLVTIVTLGASVTAQSQFSFYHLNAYISIGGFIQRIELLNTMVWLPGVVIKASIWIYCFMICVAQIFKLKDYRVLTLPAGLLLFPLTNYVADNLVHLGSYLKLTWPLYATSTAQFGIPFLLLLIGFIKKPKSNQPKGKRKQKKKESEESKQE